MADELLRALGREQRRADSREQALDPSTESASVSELMLRRFDDDERESLLDAVFEAVDAKGRDEGDEGDASEEREESEERKESEEREPSAAPESADAAEVVSLESRRPARIWLAAAVAVAAAILLALLLRGPSESTDPPKIASLPAYTVTQLSGGAATVRDRPDAPPKEVELSPDAKLDWELAPDRPVRDAVGLVILATAEGAARTLVPPVEVSPEGVVRMYGSAQTLLALPEGHWKLELVVVPKPVIPEPSDAEAVTIEARWPRHVVWATIAQ